MESTEYQPGTTAGDPLSEVIENVSEMAQILFAAGSVTDTLAQVVETAVASIEGCDCAGLFLVEKDVITIPVHTDPLVDEIDDLQTELGEGPCLAAMSQRTMFYAADLLEDIRWPRFGHRATAAGIRSILALPLNGSGALNLYARLPGAFGVVDRARAAILASLADLALSVAHSHEAQERRSDNLNLALSTREVIGQAQGILMERERITPDQAFGILRRASQHLNRKLRDVAQDLVDTGERPDTG